MYATRAIIQPIAIMKVLLAAAFVFAAMPSVAAPTPTVRAKVFFMTDTPQNPNTNMYSLKAVYRTVPASGPLGPAMTFLLKGPTKSEQKRGFSALDTFDLKRARITHGVGRWTINFLSADGHKPWAGDMSPGRFKTAVEWTAKRLVRGRVVVEVDGDPKFDSVE